ncbi:MAG: hypothetical protein J6W03_05710 [Bacteroidaceae bacterium]|nr:hypothetical protein [Bacteroidaceae bacterium]
MKRSVLLLLTLLSTVCSKAQITVGDNQTWWGYFDEANADYLPYDGCLGHTTKGTIDAVIKIPASEELVSGGSIKAIRLWLGNDVSAISSALRVWISTSLPTQSSIRADYRKNVTKGNFVAGLNEIELDSAFEVGHRDIYVGYTISISKKSTPIMAYGNDVPDLFYYRLSNGTNYGDWTDCYGRGKGILALQVLVEYETLPTNCVTVADFGGKMLFKGASATLPITITNKGTNDVRSIAYTITSDQGEPSEETRKTFTTMAPNGSKTFNIRFYADEQHGKSIKTFTVTKVNDEPNTAYANSGQGFIITLKEQIPVTPVIEEFTGTWCGWCPRGMVGMESVRETYGDQVVQIAAHSGDIMQIGAYNEVINAYAGGYPSSITDRLYSVDPSSSGLKSALNNSFNRMALAAIDLSAEWESAEQNTVVFNATTRFSFTDYNDQYAIAFVLVEDGLKGTSSSWAQQNYYAGQSVGGDMAWWCQQGSTVTGIEFNHVAVAGWNVKNGTNGSVDPNIDADVEQTYTFKGSISGNSLIQDKTKLKAVALLIDRSTGQVENAAQSVIEDFATAVSSVSSDSKTPAAMYSLDGRSLPAAQRGINIIRMADGSVRKVLVK